MKKALLLLFFVFAFFSIYFLFFYKNVKNDYILYIYSKNVTYESIFDTLISKNVLHHSWSFDIVAKIAKYPEKIKPGKYILKKDDNNVDIIKKISRSQHYPVIFTFNNIRTKENFVKKVDTTFLFPSNNLLVLLNDTLFLREKGLTPETAISIFIPNTYEFYYDIDATTFFNNMLTQYSQFWSSHNRYELAESIGLTPTEVITLASIVEEENFREGEKAIIAGLYINRLQKGMKLQADPTIKFAIGDFSVKRILHEHLTIDSPYNTYLYEGLPPGPIRMPAISTIDSVLHYRKHNYLYMCAKEDLSGNHNFTANANEHINNANRYRKTIDRLEKKR